MEGETTPEGPKGGLVGTESHEGMWSGFDGGGEDSG